MHRHEMCQLTIVNKAGEVVAEEVVPETFVSFKRQQGKGSAVLVELHCGESIFVDTARMLRRLPKGVMYKARLLTRATRPPASLDSTGHDVWVEV